MLGSIKYNLGHLLDFGGRDARQTFWFYVLFLVILNILVSIAVAVPMMAGTMSSAIEAGRAGASEEAMQARIAAEMGSAMGDLMWVSVAANVATSLLLLAAFVRRLHDSDKSGWWAALVMAAQAAGIAVSIRMMDVMEEFMVDAMNPANMQAMLERQSEMSTYSLIGWIAPLVVIVFGVLPSTDGPNRYGEEPVRF